jgi:hypothetical protein
LADAPIIPITVPEMAKIRQLADDLHAKEQPYSGEAWGWPVIYEAEYPEAPLDSNLTYMPASFTIGVFGVWFVSFTWEHGRTEESLEFVDAKTVSL